MEEHGFEQECDACAEAGLADEGVGMDDDYRLEAQKVISHQGQARERDRAREEKERKELRDCEIAEDCVCGVDGREGKKKRGRRKLNDRIERNERLYIHYPWTLSGCMSGLLPVLRYLGRYSKITPPPNFGGGAPTFHLPCLNSSRLLPRSKF